MNQGCSFVFPWGRVGGVRGAILNHNEISVVFHVADRGDYWRRYALSALAQHIVYLYPRKRGRSDCKVSDAKITW